MSKCMNVMSRMRGKQTMVHNDMSSLQPTQPITAIHEYTRAIMGHSS